MPGPTRALLIISALGAIVAVYGGVTGTEEILGAGVAAAALPYAFMPVLYQRSKKKERLKSRVDALLVWEYCLDEAERIAVHEMKRTRKSSVGLSILLAVCLAIIFAPFIVIAETAEIRSLLLGIGLAAVFLPFLSIYLAPAYTASQIRKTPCLTIVGHDYILVCNRYIGINDRGDLKLKTAGVATRDHYFPVLVLVYTFRGRYGGRINYTVEVPIPQDRVDEAERFAGTQKKRG